MMVTERGNSDIKMADILEANVIFLTNLSKKHLLLKPRFHMYEAECRRLGLSLAVFSMADDIEAKYDHYLLNDARTWARNLDLYDRLFDNPDALIISQGVGEHALGLILTQMWRPNRVLLDYDTYDLKDPNSGYTSIEKFFPSLGGNDLLRTVAHNAAASVATSKPLLDVLVDFTPNAFLIPTGFPRDLFSAQKIPSCEAVHIAWLGTVDTVEDAKEPLLAIEWLNQLPDNLRRKIKLHLIGDGALWKSIAGQIDGVPFDLKFHDRSTDAETAAVLGGVSVGLCLPSNTVETAARDGRDCVAMLLAGMAVCTLKQGEPGRLVKDGETGSVCANLEEFRKKLESLIVDRDLRDMFGQNASQQARRDYAYGFDASRLGEIIAMAYAGDCRSDGPTQYTHARDQRNDAWQSMEAFAHLFAPNVRIAS